MLAAPNEGTLRVAYFLTHPIQYQSPLIRSVRAAGIDLRVVYGPMSGEWSAADAELGRREPWDLPLLEGYPHEFVSAPLHKGLLGFLVLRARQQEVLERMRPDAVWIHGWGDAHAIAAWVAAWQLDIPILLRGEAHRLCLKGGALRRALHRVVLAPCFRTVYRFLAIGSANRDFYLDYGVAPDRIVSTPYAVDNVRFSRNDAEVARQVDDWRQRLDIQQGDLVVGFCGKLKTAKRPDWLLEALAAMTSEWPAERRPWILFLGDGPLRPRMEELAGRLYPQRCHFLGFQNQSKLPALYQLLDLLVLPSKFEPWGLVVNEAMAAGCAAVVSDSVGAAPDLLPGQPETGGVFKSDSLPQLQHRLQEWLTDQVRLRRAGHAAASRMKTWSFAEDVAGIREALGTLSRAPTSRLPPPPVRTGVVAGYMGVHQVFQMAAAAAEVGRLEHLYCSLISFPHRWGRFLARSFFIPSAAPLGTESLPPERVSELPLPLLVQRSLERCLKPRKLDPIHANRWFGKLIADRLPRHARTAGIAVGAETCALELFRAAADLGMRRVLDCHGIPTPFLQAGIDRAAAEFGLPAPKLLDSPDMTERKQQERDLADVLVVCSELQRDIYRRMEVPGERLQVAPLWVDSAFWHPKGDRQMTAKRQPLRILFAGSGSLAKGVPYLLEALNLVSKDVELTLVGSVQSELRPLIARLRCSVAELAFCRRHELRELYWHHDVLVLPSLGDSFGFVAVEAMACGLPVVVTDRCGAPLPDASWRVPAFSAQALATRFEVYAADRTRVQTDGALAADFARNFTSQRYRQTIRAIYDGLGNPGSLPLS